MTTQHTPTPFPHNPDPAPYHNEPNPGRFKKSPAKKMESDISRLERVHAGLVRALTARVAELEAALQNLCDATYQWSQQDVDGPGGFNTAADNHLLDMAKEGEDVLKARAALAKTK